MAFLDSTTPGPSVRLTQARATATQALLRARSAEGFWTGTLSSSALSTATAVIALSRVDPVRHHDFIEAGLRWLAAQQREDGGWGDTPLSRSNISTTALAWAAFGATHRDREFADSVARAAAYCGAGAAGPRPVVDAIIARYGRDRTFSVPILMTLALSGRLGADGWQWVPRLPFELAALPPRIWGILRLPVVSYALPALIAIGQVIHHHAPTRNPVLRGLRAWTRQRTLRVLETLQPPNGGFLEATPLTAFVTMSLAAMNLSGHPVAVRGTEFLRNSARPDGSWAIDTNLATWSTTLAIKALSSQPAGLLPEERYELRRWLVDQQWNRVHPYTQAAPGGWAWTDLPGGVPDADDTAGALLALLHLGAVNEETERAGLAGVRWLCDLQNRDGGIPTFCRGWGTLPFDRSSPDLTAHALRAWSAWRSFVPKAARPRLERAQAKALRYLQSTQKPDGSWLPLWFGNEHAADEGNPLYGTAHVTVALRAHAETGEVLAEVLARRGRQWIADAQNSDGGWGGVPGAPSSVEETALAVEALAKSEHVAAVDRGTAWLVARVENGQWQQPAPIGFYFAKLWYYERLYPLIWTVGALGSVAD